MSDRNKIWVIDDRKEPELTSLGDPLEPAPRPQPRPAPPRPARRFLPRPSRPKPAAAPSRPAPKPARPVHSAWLLASAYALGPAALLLDRAARRSASTVMLVLGWFALAAALGVGWWAAAGGRVTFGLLPWLTFGSVPVLAAGTSLWARGLGRVARRDQVAAHAWSPHLTGPWTAALLGLAAPGSAQVLARRPRQAVVTVWTTWPFLAAVLLAVQARLLWAGRAAFVPWGLEAPAVERMLLLATALAVVAPLLWLAQALEGARVLAARAGRWQGVRGDWCALALAATLAVAVVVNDPATLAAGLGDYAGDLATDGLTVTPLLLTRAARQLDPGQPAYALQEADLYAAAGAPERAREVRAELDRALQPYVGALMREQRQARRGSGLRAAQAASIIPLGSAAHHPFADEPTEPDAATLLLPARAEASRPAGPPAPAAH